MFPAGAAREAPGSQVFPPGGRRFPPWLKDSQWGGCCCSVPRGVSGMVGFPEPLSDIQDTGPRQLVKQAPRNRHSSWEERRGSVTTWAFPRGSAHPILTPGWLGTKLPTALSFPTQALLINLLSNVMGLPSMPESSRNVLGAVNASPGPPHSISPALSPTSSILPSGKKMLGRYLGRLHHTKRKLPPPHWAGPTRVKNKK